MRVMEPSELVPTSYRLTVREPIKLQVMEACASYTNTRPCGVRGAACTTAQVHGIPKFLWYINKTWV